MLDRLESAYKTCLNCSKAGVVLGWQRHRKPKITLDAVGSSDMAKRARHAENSDTFDQTWHNKYGVRTFLQSACQDRQVSRELLRACHTTVYHGYTAKGIQ